MPTLPLRTLPLRSSRCVYRSPFYLPVDLIPSYYVVNLFISLILILHCLLHPHRLVVQPSMASQKSLWCTRTPGTLPQPQLPIVSVDHPSPRARTVGAPRLRHRGDGRKYRTLFFVLRSQVGSWALVGLSLVCSVFRR